MATTNAPIATAVPTDGAMAMTRVIIQEFYIERRVEYFRSYAKAYTDLPFAVILDSRPRGGRLASMMTLVRPAESRA